MRTTVYIDDDLMRELRTRAAREEVPLTRLINRLLRQGIKATRQRKADARRGYRERVFSMGEPRVGLTKALHLAATLEDEEIIEKIARRK